MPSEISWTYYATEQRIKQKNLFRYLLGAAMHAVGPIFALILYFDYQEKGVFEKVTAILFSIIFIFDLAIWYFWLNNVLKFKERSYSLHNVGIDIIETVSQKKKQHEWGQFTGFSLDARSFDKNNKNIPAPAPDSEHIYLGIKNGLQSMVMPYMTIDVEPSVRKVVEEILRSKLQEKFYSEK
ncbi:MAG: hypothetical protein WCK11_02390 [Candidatus Falkowbacteria bacterium]